MQLSNAMSTPASVVRLYFSPVPAWTSLGCCWKSTRFLFTACPKPLLYESLKGRGTSSHARLHYHLHFFYSFIYLFSFALLTCTRLIPVDISDLRCMLKWPQNNSKLCHFFLPFLSNSKSMQAECDTEKRSSIMGVWFVCSSLSAYNLLYCCMLAKSSSSVFTNLSINTNSLSPAVDIAVVEQTLYPQPNQWFGCCSHYKWVLKGLFW